jgi:hypothetical protein
MSGDLSPCFLRYSLIVAKSGSTIIVSKPPSGFAGSLFLVSGQTNGRSGLLLFATKTKDHVPDYDTERGFPVTDTQFGPKGLSHRHLD